MQCQMLLSEVYIMARLMWDEIPSIASVLVVKRLAISLLRTTVDIDVHVHMVKPCSPS